MTKTDITIYKYKDYRLFLQDTIIAQKEHIKGIQSKMAAFTGCQSAYISMVLRGKADLSLEQAVKVSEFFGFLPDEEHFFLLLVQFNRTSMPKLKSYFEKQIQLQIENRQDLSKRLQYQTKLTFDQRARFYSAWTYSAIHIALTIPELRTIGALSKYFDLPTATVVDVCEFLTTTGLAKEDGGKFVVGPTVLHTGKDNPFLSQSHIFWRMLAISAIQKPTTYDFHYSSVVSIGKKDLPLIKEKMIRAIEEIREIVKNSPEEDVAIYSFDLFPLGR